MSTAAQLEIRYHVIIRGEKGSISALCGGMTSHHDVASPKFTMARLRPTELELLQPTSSAAALASVLFSSILPHNSQNTHLPSLGSQDRLA